MQVKAPVVKVDSTHYCRLVITKALLCMVEAALVFVYPHSHCKQILMIGTGDTAYIPLVGYLGSDYAYIYSRLCRKVKHGKHFIVGDKVRCGDVNVVLSIVYHIHVDKFAYVLGVKGRVSVGDNKALCIVSRTVNLVFAVVVL